MRRTNVANILHNWLYSTNRRCVLTTFLPASLRHPFPCRSRQRVSFLLFGKIFRTPHFGRSPGDEGQSSRRRWWVLVSLKIQRRLWIYLWNTYFAFIDLTKTFDYMNWNSLWGCISPVFEVFQKCICRSTTTWKHERVCRIVFCMMAINWNSLVSQSDKSAGYARCPCICLLAHRTLN